MSKTPPHKLVRYWNGRLVRHLDSVASLGTRRHSAFHIRNILGRSLEVESTVRVRNRREISCFLRRCRYVSDDENFGSSDYCIPLVPAANAPDYKPNFSVDARLRFFHHLMR